MAADDAAAAYAEARRRIAAWRPGEPLRLGFTALDRLPNEIAELHELRELDVSATQVADLCPLQGLTNLQSLTCFGTPVEVEGEPPRQRAGPKVEQPPLDVEAERPARELWYFSYAREPNERAGRPVDAFCNDAARADRKILRDVEKLRYGESIQDFMRHELAQGDRVFVWLTDAYLRSPYCMVELFELWRRADGDAERFYAQVRLVLDVSIRMQRERLEYVQLWQKEKAAVDEIAPVVAQMEGPFAAKRDAIHRFASQTWEILEFIGNHVAYGSFEELRAKELGHG